MYYCTKHYLRPFNCKFTEPFNCNENNKFDIYFFVTLRYQKEVMDTVEELAHGVVQEYRETQKDRLKRTFVSGADAAGAKVNRGKAKTC